MFLNITCLRRDLVSLLWIVQKAYYGVYELNRRTTVWLQESCQNTHMLPLLLCPKGERHSSAPDPESSTAECMCLPLYLWGRYRTQRSCRWLCRSSAGRGMVLGMVRKVQITSVSKRTHHQGLVRENSLHSQSGWLSHSFSREAAGGSWGGIKWGCEEDE